MTLPRPIIKMASDIKWQDIFDEVRKNDIQFIRFMFIDLFGNLKNMTIHSDELEGAMRGRLMFDGSSVLGFSGVEDSDLHLRPDPDTFQTDTWSPAEKNIGIMFCDVYRTDGQPFEGCPRNILKRTVKEAEKQGYRLNVGLEGEFFLFKTDEFGEPVVNLHDEAGYCDTFPLDTGEAARQEMLLTMKRLGFQIEGSHHEVAHGQHEINFKYEEALPAADKWMLFKQIVKFTAAKHGLYASFIPKPFAGDNGNAMHCNLSLIDEHGRNVFYDAKAESGLSDTAKHYIGGLLAHVRGFAALANPTVNSYKRLIPGYEAPCHVAWSSNNRTALIRIPNSRGNATRIELRNPDPTANPYLTLAVTLKSGLKGINEGIEPPEEVVGDIDQMSVSERKFLQIDSYPRDLHSALEQMRKDSLVKETLGEHAFHSYIDLKQLEADEFLKEVHEWERMKYLKAY